MPKDQVVEKVFRSRTPKGRAASDIINNIKESITKNQLKNKHYISYQSVKNIDGEYFLMRPKKNIEPLKEYLAANQIDLETTINWLKTILILFKQAKLANLEWQEIVPSSLWVNSQGEIFIVDPIITKQLSQYRNDLNFDLKEKLLIPPGVLKGEEWNEQAQIYSICSFFYYLLTVKPLFSSQKNAKLMAEIKQIKPLEPQIINPKLSDQLNQLLVNCLAKDYLDRPTDFTAVINKINNLKNNNQLRSKVKKEKKIKKKQLWNKKLFKLKTASFWFLHNYGKLSTVLLLVIAVLTTFVLSGGYEPVVDQKTDSESVVKYFYQAIDNKNINLLEETINPEQLPHIESMVVNGYVIEIAKNLFSAPQSSEKNSSKQEKISKHKKRVFSIEKLKLKNINNEPNVKYKAKYQFVFLEQDKKVRVKMQDYLLLTKVDQQWKIKKVRGDIQNRDFLRKKEEKLQGK